MSEKNDTLVRVEHLKKYFPVKGIKGPGVQAVEDISIEIKRGETLGLVVEKQPSAVQYYSYIILLPERSFMTEKQFLRDRIPGNEMRMESFIR